MHTYTYPRPALTVDLLVCDTSGSLPKILLIQRKKEPFQWAWALPGGFVEEHEPTTTAARREAREETGLKLADDAPLQLLGVFDKPFRDPRGWTLSVVYFIEGDFSAQHLCAADDAVSLAWFTLDKLPLLAFDHREIIIKYRDKLSE